MAAAQDRTNVSVQNSQREGGSPETLEQGEGSQCSMGINAELVGQIRRETTSCQFATPIFFFVCVPVRESTFATRPHLWPLGFHYHLCRQQSYILKGRSKIFAGQLFKAIIIINWGSIPSCFIKKIEVEDVSTLNIFG